MLEKLNFNDSFFTHVIDFSGEPCFLSTSQLSFPPEQFSTLNFQRTYLMAIIVWAFCLKTLEIKLSKYSSTTMYIAKLVLFYEKPFWREYLIQAKMYSAFWSDNRSKLDTPFPIRDFVSIFQGP